MAEANRKLVLSCDVTRSKFTLTAEGEDWRQDFGSFDDAYEEAEARVSETVPLVLRNERGKTILETTVSPCPAELVKLRYPLMGRADR